jgi:hypothetical protein
MFKRLLLLIFITVLSTSTVVARERFFHVQAIDTMKFSRDIAREKMNNVAYDKEIETQTGNIAGTGATHIAISTPYDDEFIPYMKRWVNTARRHNLKVWFRGNFSGWEGWFDYPKIGRNEHSKMLQYFIENNSDLFENGDVFTSCPECENGGEGDPRITRDIEGFRSFLIYENTIVQEEFLKMNKVVITNYYSMNGDVAQLIMDKDTTRQLGAVITIDHYVSTPEKLAIDVHRMAEGSGGKVVLGEFGAPIPDIHGDMTEQTQADWVDRALENVIKGGFVESVNYWTNMGGSTMAWNDDYSPRQVVQTITKYFKPYVIQGNVKDTIGNLLDGVRVSSGLASTESTDGHYSLPTISRDTRVQFSKPGYLDVYQTITLTEGSEVADIALTPIGNSLWDTLYALFSSLFHKVIR